MRDSCFKGGTDKLNQVTYSFQYLANNKKQPTVLKSSLNLIPICSKSDANRTAL